MRIDVGDLLHDPDFVDDVIHIKRKTRTNTKGENILDETPIPTIGCVQPIDGKTIFKLPEEFRVADVQTFWIQSEITASSPGKYSDILVFRGKRYQVQTVFDWTQWGEGWCEGTCVKEVPA